MSIAEFTAFYPQFAGFTPVVVLTEYIRQANARFASFSEEDAEEARRLYTAHKLTMYARVALLDGGEPPATASGFGTPGPGASVLLVSGERAAAPAKNLAGGEVTGNEQSPQWGAATIDGAGARYTYAQLAAAGQAQQKIASKKVGEVAVTYSSGTSSSSVSVQTDLADLTETDFGLQLLSLIKMYARPVYVP